jgi:hypothetical protein
MGNRCLYLKGKLSVHKRKNKSGGMGSQQADPGQWNNSTQ